MTTILECTSASLLRSARSDGKKSQRDERDHIAQFINMNKGAHSPEMAHFFAQNIIARFELFSEN